LQIESIPAVPGDLRVETRKSDLTAGEASHLRIAGTVHEHRHACSKRCGGQQVRVVMTIDHTLTQEAAGEKHAVGYAFSRWMQCDGGVRSGAGTDAAVWSRS